MKAKKTLSLLLALVMVFSLAACSSGSTTQSAAPSQGGTTQQGGETQQAQQGSALAGTYDIKVWVDTAVIELTQTQIDRFNSTNEDGITINATLQAVSEADAATQMITDVEAGGDIYIFAQDQFARLVQAGALAKLGVAAAENVTANNTPESVAAVTLAGDMYGYPVTADNGYFMYYDKSVIPEADIGSVEKLIADCEAAGKYFAFNLNDSGWYAASWFFGTGCVSEWTLDDTGMAVALNDTFDSPEGLIAVKGMKKLLDSPAHLDSSDAASQFANGAAVLICGTWAYSDIAAILGDNLGAAEMPSFEVDGQTYHLGSYNGFKLMGVKPQTDAARQAALHKLAQYLTSEECQLERFNERAWGPANINAQKDPAVLANPAQIAINAQAPYATPQGNISGAWWNISKVIATEVKEATDEAGLQTALDNYRDKCYSLIGVGGYVFVGAWNGWDNADMTTKLTDTGSGVYAITLDVKDDLDYKGGRIVAATTWDTDKGAAQVTEGADLIDVENAGGDNNIIFLEGGNYTVTWDSNANTISIVKN